MNTGVTVEPRARREEHGMTGSATRYEWHVAAVRDGRQVVDVRGICRHYTTAVRHVQAELAAAPGDADAYGSVRGLTANPATGAYQRWDRQAVAVHGEHGITWFRDRSVAG